MRPRLRLATFALLTLVASAIDCGRDVTTSPLASVDGGARIAHGISFRPVFPAAYAAAGSAAADLIPFTNVRVTLRHSDGTIALDTLIAFPSTAESVQLSLDVHLLPSAPASGEPMSLTLNYINSAGVTVFTGGPVTVIATTSALGQTSTPPVTVPVVYSGPGANAARVVISPRTQSVNSGSTFAFTAQALDAANNVIPNTPIVFSSSNPALASLTSNASGSGTALTGRGTAQITASLLTGGLTDVGTLTVQPLPSSFSVISGTGQSASVGATLAQPVVVRVLASDGLGVAGVPVTFSVTNGGSVGNPSVTTDANGNAQTTWRLGTAAGTQTLTAAASGFTFTTTVTATATTLPATKLAIAQQPASAAVGAPITVAVSAQDANGGTVTSFTGPITLALGTNTPGATLAGATTANAVAGVATFSGLSLNRVGSAYTLVASSGTLAPATTTAFDVTAAAAAQIVVVSGNNQTAAQGSALPLPVIVNVTDAQGNNVAGTTVQFVATSGNGSVAPASAATNAQGQASTVWTLGSAVGAQTISAVANGLAPATISATATGTGSGVTQLVFNPVPVSTTAGVAFTTTVEARNASSAVVTSFQGPVTLAFGANPQNGTLGGTVTVNAVNGVATFSNTITRAGTGYTLVASSGTINSTPAPFTVNPGTPSALTVTSGGSQTGTVSQPLASPVVVTLNDPFGNAIAGQTVTFAVTVGGGSVVPTTASTSSLGQATTIWTLGSTVGTQSITASAGGVPTITINATGSAAAPGPATSLVISSGAASATAGATITPSVVVQARDAGNQVATSFNGAVTLAFGANPASGTLAGATTVTAVNGVATFSNLTVTRASPSYTLVASGGTLPASAAVGLNVVAGAASALSFTTQPPSSGAGVVFTPAPVVTAVDAYGNPATSFAGTVTVGILNNPSNGVLSGTTTVTAVAGQATFSNLKINANGTGYTLSATTPSNPSLTTAVSSSFNITSANIMWTNASGGTWSTAANWNLNRAPVSGDSVVITLPGTYTVTLDVPYSGTYITLGGTSGSQTLMYNSVPLTLSNALTVGQNGVFKQVQSSLNGSGIVTNQGTLNLVAGGVTLPIANTGTVLVEGAEALDGAFSNAAGATLRVQGDGTAGNSAATFANGFTNAGLVDLTTTGSSFASSLNITSGTLTNTGTLQTSVGAGGTRSITGSTANQGTFTVNQPLTLANSSGVVTNSGTLAVNAPLTVQQSGGSFVNSGTIAVSTGSTLSVIGGTFGTQTGSTLSGGGALQVVAATGNFAVAPNLPSFSLTNSTVSVPAGGYPAVNSLIATSSNINGPGTLTTGAGQSVSLNSSTVNTPFNNSGTVTIEGPTQFTAAFSNLSNSTLRVQGDGSAGNAALTVSAGFTNAGLIDLTTAGSSFSTALTVSSGTLTNASGGTIQTSVGAGGTRSLVAVIANQGTLLITQPLQITNVSGTSANASGGSILLNGGDLTISMGGSATFNNAGTITVSSGRVFTLAGGSFANQSGATLNGNGTLSLNAIGAAFTAGIAVPTFALSSVILAVPAGGFPSVTTFSAISSTLNGPGTLTNAVGSTMSLRSTDVNAPLVNNGSLLVEGTQTFTNAFSNGSQGVLTLLGDGSAGNANLTVNNGVGFTNAGLLELTTSGSSFSSGLAVTTGTLTNTGSLLTSVGAGGQRFITATLDNQSTLTVNQPLSLAHNGGNSTNSGTINVNTDLQLSQTGTSPTFVNSGGITVASGATFTITGGSFAEQSNATLGGVGTLSLSNITAGFSGPLTTARLVANASTVGVPAGGFPSAFQFTATSSTINGPGTLTNAVGQNLNLVNTTVTTAVSNSGLLLVEGGVGFSGALTNASGSTIRIQGDGSAGNASLTVSNSFTNNGVIDLTTTGSSFASALTVSAGTLTNSATGTVQTSVGAGGTRTVNASVDNLGLITVNQPLAIYQVSSTNTNNGTINVSGGDLVINLTGTSPSYVNANGISIASGRTLTISGGTFTEQSGAVLSGAGTLSLSSNTAALNGPVSVPGLTLSSSTIALPSGGLTVVVLNSTNSTINGPGVLTNSSGSQWTFQYTNVAATFANQGPLLFGGTGTFSGSFSNSSAGTLRVQGDGSAGNANLTVNNGFTNSGLIDLTTAGSSFSSGLVITSGTLNNASGATFQTSVGAGGPRNVTGLIANAGTITINQPLTLAHNGGTDTNSGAINVTGGDLTIVQSGTSPALTNTGGIAVAAGRTLTINGGTFTEQGQASLGGAGTLSISGVTAVFNSSLNLPALNASGSNVSVPNGGFPSAFTLNANGTTFTGPGSISNGSGQMMTFVGSSVQTPLSNAGTILVESGTTFTGAFVNGLTGTVEVQGDGSGGNASLTISNSFTNNGLIDLTSAGGGFSSALAISSGSLTNASPGILQTSVGAGGTRTIAANVINQGTLNVGVGGIGTLQINGGFTTTGTVNLKLASASTYDRINIAGADTLGGTLNVTSSYTPTSGSTFQIISSTSQNQTFGTNNLPPGFTNPPTYGATTVTLVKP